MGPSRQNSKSDNFCFMIQIPKMKRKYRKRRYLIKLHFSETSLFFLKMHPLKKPPFSIVFFRFWYLDNKTKVVRFLILSTGPHFRPSNHIFKQLFFSKTFCYLFFFKNATWISTLKQIFFWKSFINFKFQFQVQVQISCSKSMFKLKKKFTQIKFLPPKNLEPQKNSSTKILNSKTFWPLLDPQIFFTPTQFLSKTNI